MPIFHLHMKNISRGDKRSAVAAAAYRAGEVLPNDAEEKDSHFGGRRNVVFTAILLPAGAPAWMGDRARLWNAVEAAEKRKDARLAKEVELALPRELTPAQRLQAVHALALTFTAQGLIADIAIHDDGKNHNPHAHIMLTTRHASDQGFGLKIRAADDRAFLTATRDQWAATANAALVAAGVAASIDPRSHAERGLDRTPTQHQGPDRAQRQIQRAQHILKRAPMDIETALSLNLIVSKAQTADRFPLLAARDDWPPQDRRPPGSLSRDEAAEFRVFWRDVDRYTLTRSVGQDKRELEDANPRDILEPATADRLQKALSTELPRITAETERFGFEDLGHRALRQFEAMERNVNQRLSDMGLDVRSDIDWKEFASDMRAFRETLIQVRLNEIARGDRILAEERTLPERGPNNEVITRGELETAQDRMIEEVNRDNYPESQQPRAGFSGVEREAWSKGRDAQDNYLDSLTGRKAPARETELEPERSRSRDDDWLNEITKDRNGH